MSLHPTASLVLSMQDLTRLDKNLARTIVANKFSRKRDKCDSPPVYQGLSRERTRVGPVKCSQYCYGRYGMVLNQRIWLFREVPPQVICPSSD